MSDGITQALALFIGALTTVVLMAGNYYFGGRRRDDDHKHDRED